jgi:hypothetical protein
MALLAAPMVFLAVHAGFMAARTEPVYALYSFYVHALRRGKHKIHIFFFHADFF